MARSCDGSTHFIQTSLLVNYITNWTLCAWVKRSAPGTSRNDCIYNRSTHPSFQRQIYMGYSTADKLILDQPFVVGIVVGAATITDTNWHHCAARRSGNDFTTFIDGAVDGTATAAIGQENCNTGSQWASEGWFGLRLAGSIAEAAIWDVALSDGEVTALAKGVLPSRIRRASLGGYWPFHGIQSPEPDFSGSGNSATLTGTAKANHPPVNLMSVNDKQRYAVVQAAASSSGPFPWFQRSRNLSGGMLTMG